MDQKKFELFNFWQISMYNSVKFEKLTLSTPLSSKI